MMSARHRDFACLRRRVLAGMVLGALVGCVHAVVSTPDRRPSEIDRPPGSVVRAVVDESGGVVGLVSTARVCGPGSDAPPVPVFLEGAAGVTARRARC